MNDAFGTPRTALVLGGNSDIAHATVKLLVGKGLESVVLAVRDVASLEERLGVDPLPDVNVHAVVWDANDIDNHRDLLAEAHQFFGDIDLVLCAVGTLGHAAGLSATEHQVAEMVSNNFTGPASAIAAVTHDLIRQGHGTMVVISSVAGLRPRRSNYVYGSAKAGLDAFVRGLQDATCDTPIRIHLIRPGFVRTKMTAGLSPAPFAVDADQVACAFVAVIVRSSHSVSVTPRLLGVVFMVLQALPTRIWRLVSRNR